MQRMTPPSNRDASQKRAARVTEENMNSDGFAGKHAIAGAAAINAAPQSIERPVRRRAPIINRPPTPPPSRYLTSYQPPPSDAVRPQGRIEQAREADGVGVLELEPDGTTR